MTDEDFRDFHLRLDFKIARMANSGLFLRAAREGGNPAFSGCEIQILDDFNWERATDSKLKPWQFTGSLYGSVPPAVKALNPIGSWNSLEIRYVGSRLNVSHTVLRYRSLVRDRVSSLQDPTCRSSTSGGVSRQPNARELPP